MKYPEVGIVHPSRRRVDGRRYRESARARARAAASRALRAPPRRRLAGAPRPPPRPPAALRDLHARDHEPLDLGRALEQLVDLRVAEPLLERVVRDPASGPTRSISAVVAHIATSPALSLLIEPWPPVIGTPLRPIHVARHTSRRAASISVATSASTCCTRCCSSSGPSLVGLALEAVDRPLVRGARDAEGARADHRARDLEGRERARRTRALARPRALELALEAVEPAEQVLHRHADVVEDELRGLRRADPELVLFLAHPKPGVPFSTMNDAWPRWPSAGSTVATITLTSAMPPLEMKTFAPLRTHSSPSRRAVVRSDRTSDPALASVTA